MRLNRKEKGFTIVELVIVIAVIAVLAAILIPTFVGLVNKANVAADNSLVRELNNAIAIDLAEKGETKHETMHDALAATEKNGFVVQRIKSKTNTNKILWDSVHGVFCYLQEGSDVVEYVPGSVESGKELAADDYRLWTIASDVDATYSTYLYKATKKTFTTNKGLDVGDEDVTSVTYENTGAAQEEVVIRTNSANTTLTIDDASEGTIYHYGSAGALNIIKCHTASYHENGKVAYAEISKGHIVLESGSKINHIHVNRKDENTFDTVKITDNGAEALPTAITRDEVSVETAKELVVTVVAQGQTEEVYVYAIGNYGTTEQTVSQNTDVDTNLGKLVLDNGAGEKTQTSAEKDVTKTNVIQIAEAEEHADTAVLLVGTNYSKYMSFAEFMDMANDSSNNGLAGYTAYLQADVDLKNEEWTPIGTKTNPFKGKFDGGNHVIRNLKINSTTGYAGLFGVVVGEQLNTPKTASDVWDDSNRAMKENGYSENKFTVVVKNLIIDGFTLNSSSSNYHGTVAGFAVDAYFANLTVKNGTISTAGKAGGVIGSTTGSVLFDNLTTESSVSINATGHTAGGIIAGTNRDYTDNSGGVAFTVAEQNGSHVAVIVNCINNATVNGVGYTGGIVGQSANTTGLELVIYNCVNNGNIYQSSTNADPMGGITASTTNLAHAFISNCTNNGTLTHSTTSTTGVYVAGIDGYGSNTKMYSCINNGNVTGYANKIAGIAAQLSSNYTEIDLDTCQNTGVIINTNQSGQTYDVYGGNWTDQNFNASTSIASSVSDIQDKLNSADAVYYNFAGYTSLEGTLTINKERSSFTINADSRICSSIVIQGNRSQNITLNIPNLECTLSGDMSNVNLIIKGENSSITLAEGASLKNVYVSNGASFTNNGTIFKLQLTDIPTATNNGTIGYMSFVVSENVTTNFTNNGTITEQVRSAGQLHLIESQGKGTVNFLNNGTINYDYENAPYDCSRYIFLSRSGDSVTLNINCTENSVIDGYQDMNWFCMYESGNTFTVKYLEGAQFTVNGAIPSTYNYNRLAQNFHKVDSLD